MRERTVARGIFLTVLAAIVVLSLKPPSPDDGVLFDPMVTNVMHLPAYAALALAAAWMLQSPGARDAGWHAPAVMGIVVTVGGGLELLQPLFGRSASVGDLVVDVLGATVAVLAWYGARVLHRRSGRLA